jgi:hypothetical protein
MIVGFTSTSVAIVFCSENNYVVNVVCSLGKIIREITGSQVELISDERMIEPNRIMLFVVTEGIHQINHVLLKPSLIVTHVKI